MINLIGDFVVFRVFSSGWGLGVFNWFSGFLGFRVWGLGFRVIIHILSAYRKFPLSLCFTNVLHYVWFEGFGEKGNERIWEEL